MTGSGSDGGVITSGTLGVVTDSVTFSMTGAIDGIFGSSFGVDSVETGGAREVRVGGGVVASEPSIDAMESAEFGKTGSDEVTGVDGISITGEFAGRGSGLAGTEELTGVSLLAPQRIVARESDV